MPLPKTIRPQKSGLTSIIVSILALFSANAHAQQVALLDSGVDPNAGLNIAPGFNYFLNIEDTSDVSTLEGEGHGTVSARLVSESFSGLIVPFVITDGAGLGLFEPQSTVARDSALSDILGRDQVRVIGITWGTAGITGSAAPLLPQLSNSNKVIAITAGDDSAAQPNALSTSSFNLSGVIIVGGTDADGDLLPQTNRAGTTQNKYVTAIGLPTLDASDGDSSWAAARISGIAGAVLQQNPNLTAAEVVEVILQSAEDRGAEGTDSEFGRGFIANAQQVLNNVIGPPVVPTQPTDSGGGGGGGSGAGLLLGGALVGALLLMRKPKEKLEKTLVLDSYGRTFQIDLNDHMQIDDGILHLNDFFHALDQTSISNGFVLPDLNTEVMFSATTDQDHRFDMIEYFSMPGDVVIEDQSADVSLAVATRLGAQTSLTGGYRVSPGLLFGGASDLESHELFGTSSFISGQSFSSVLTGFSSQAQTLTLDYQPAALSKTAFKAGLVSVDEDRRFGKDSFSTILEGEYQLNKDAGVTLQFGQIEEQGSLFGGAAGGLFGVNTATTYAVNIGGHWRTSDKFTMVANYGVGRTKVDATADSLLGNFSDLRSDWYSLGLVGNNIFRARDQIGVSFSQPLKIRSGDVDYSIPTGRDLDGLIAFDTERVDLSETNATERRLEGYYRTMLSDKLELGSFVSYRQHPNHVLEEGNELLIMGTLRYRQ